MNSKYKSIKQFISRNPYPALIRLLDHPDGSVSMICIFFIHNLLSCGINETHRTALHPHYDIIASCDGIQKIYSQFKRNAFFYLRDYTAICIGFVHKARKIENAQMRRDIIAHLKIVSLSQTDQKHKARRALTFLALNDVNNKEIEKDGFKIPQFEEGEIFDDGDDVYEVQEQEEQQQEEKKDCITQ
ncbi:MAG: hypothetical protein EZS28_047800 [Streblomastix strix]|uniref:Uncharacterized protein n=1 Tax=Streblomastix strix TaxID=222440 RepID=A0A5J4TFZ7_9EUKA|nr:MAG: hypothetical protein EZS28_047800 [Streblomastix strix]